MAEAAEFMAHLMVIMFGGVSVLIALGGAYSFIMWFIERHFG